MIAKIEFDRLNPTPAFVMKVRTNLSSIKNSIRSTKTSHKIMKTEWA